MPRNNKNVRKVKGFVIVDKKTKKIFGHLAQFEVHHSRRLAEDTYRFLYLTDAYAAVLPCTITYKLPKQKK